MPEQKFWNPYVAGVALGLVLLGSFLIMGHGIGASGAANRLAVGAAYVAAPGAVGQDAYFGQYVGPGRNVPDDWLVFEGLGVFLGGMVGAFSVGRWRRGIQMGPRTMPAWSRLGLGLLGGVFMGVAARLARGCTSGQALTGGSLLSLGSWAFMMMVFAGGYVAAPFVRRQWR